MAIGLGRMFGFRIPRELQLSVHRAQHHASSGGAGTSRCRTGSATTCTSRWAATSAASAAPTRTSSSCSCCADSGTARAGRSCSGARGTARSSSPNARGWTALLRRIGPLAHVYALLAVMGGWVLFRCETLTQALGYYAALAGFATGDALRRPLRRVPQPARDRDAAGRAWCSRRRSRGGSARGATASARAPAPPARWCWAPTSRGPASCSCCPRAFLAAGTYNPFIYFRF